MTRPLVQLPAAGASPPGGPGTGAPADSLLAARPDSGSVRDDPARPPEASSGLARRLWSAPLWAHCLALALLLAVLFPFMGPKGSLTSDEGAYAVQADALAHGSWVYDYKAAPLDPDGRYFPLVLSSQSDGHYYAYIQHPAYPMLLRGVSAVVGPTLGLHLLALLGTLGTAAAAWLLAGEVDGRLRRSAFWVAALGPALVNGYLLWGHTLSAAMAGLTLVALVRSVRRGPTRPRTIAIAAGLAAGVLLRSEGLLLAGTVGFVAACLAWRRPVAETQRFGPAPGGIRAVRAAVACVVLAGPSAVAVLTERLWVRHIVGGAYDNFTDRSAASPWLSGRFSGAWHDLFQGPNVDGPGRVLALLALVAVVSFGLVGLRRWRDDSVRALGIGVVIAIGLTAVQSVRYPLEPISGMFVVWPLALLGLVLVRWRTEESVVRILGVTVGLFALAVVTTEYPAGGGLEWGGRFFFPVLAPVAVLAVVGLDRRLRLAPLAGQRAATGLLAAIVFTGALSGVASGARIRGDASGLAAAVARHPAPVTVTTVPALPRVAWSTPGTVHWMLTDTVGLHDLLAGLRSRGLTEVVVVIWRPGPGSAATAAGFEAVEEMDEPALGAHNLGLYVLRA